MGVKPLGALGTANVDPGLGDLDAEVLAQAIDAGTMMAGHDFRETVPGMMQEAQGALKQLRARPTSRFGR